MMWSRDSRLRAVGPCELVPPVSTKLSGAQPLLNEGSHMQEAYRVVMKPSSDHSGVPCSGGKGREEGGEDVHDLIPLIVVQQVQEQGCVEDNPLLNPQIHEALGSQLLLVGAQAKAWQRCQPDPASTSATPSQGE